MPEPLLPTTPRWRWIVLALLGLALLLRVGVVFENRSEYVPRTDAEHFDLIARSIADGGAWGIPLPPAEGPSAVRAPGYPAFLAAIYVVAGDGAFTAARLANAVLGVAVVALVGLVASQLFGRRVALVALAIAAVHPALALVGSSMQLEPLLVTLSLGAVAATLQHRRAPRGLRWPILAGVLLGLAALTRELGFLFLPSLAWILWTARPPGIGRWAKQAIAAPLALILVCGLMIVPWTVRNYLRLDELVPVTTSAGFGLVGTYNPTADADQAQWVTPYQDPATAEVLLAMDHPTELEVDDVLRERALDYVADHPGYPLEVAFWNTVRLFDLDGGDYSRFIAPFLPYPNYLTDLAIWCSYLVLAAAVVGAFLRAARRAPLALWLVPVVIFVFMVVTLPASIRYRASLEPFLIFLAALAVVAAYDRFVARPAGPELPEPDPGSATVAAHDRPGPRRPRQLRAPGRG